MSPNAELPAARPDREPRRDSRGPRLLHLVGPGYAVGGLFILIPFLDNVISVWPFRLGEVAWRFGAVGLFSRSLLTPLLGLFLLLGLSILAEHRLFTRVVA